jgi:WXG100 family type VII secretion target
MAANTVNLQKMKSVAAELDKIYISMTNTKKKLDETVASLGRVWQGEGAAAYQAAYSQNAQDFALLAEAIRSCSSTLTVSANTYSKADAAAADAIKAKMAKG